MNQVSLRKLIFSVMGVVALFLERSIGLPVVSLSLLAISLTFLTGWSKIAVLSFLGVLLGLVYSLPFGVAIAILLVLSLSLEYEVLGRRTLVFTLALLGSVLVVKAFTKIELSQEAWLYHLAVLAGIVIFMRYWLYRHRRQVRLQMSSRLYTKST